jgi:hypothetical protein
LSLTRHHEKDAVKHTRLVSSVLYYSQVLYHSLQYLLYLMTIFYLVTTFVILLAILLAGAEAVDKVI